MPANLYGRGDNFDLKSSHVLPALIKKFTLAKIKNLPQVEVWGSGNVKREFLNVEDLSSAIYFLIQKNQARFHKYWWRRTLFYKDDCEYD